MAKWRRSVPIKELLLLLFFVLEGAQVAIRLRSLGISGGLLVYLAVFLSLAVTLVAVSRIASGWLRWIVALLLYGAALFQSASERIIGDHLTYDAFLSLMGSTGFVGDATAQYGSAMIVAALCCLPLLLAIGLPRGRSRSRPLQRPVQRAVGAPAGVAADWRCRTAAAAGERRQALRLAEKPIKAYRERVLDIGNLAEVGPARGRR